MRDRQIQVWLGLAGGLVLSCGGVLSSDGESSSASGDPGGGKSVTSRGGTGVSGPVVARGGTSSAASGAVGGAATGHGGTAPSGGETLPRGAEFTSADLADITSSWCAGASVECEPIPVVGEVVVDVSRSLARVMPQRSATSFEVVRTALLDLLASSPWFASDFGLSFFSSAPSVSSSSCVHEDLAVAYPETLVPGDLSRVPLFEVALQQVTVQPARGAAIVDAYQAAVERTLKHNAAFGVTGGKIVLVTDGFPSYDEGCVGTGDTQVSPEAVIAAIAAARASLVDTIVIGGPGSLADPWSGSFDARPWLSRAARAGGHAKFLCSDEGPNYCHIDMTQGEDIAQLLPQILAPSCAVCETRLATDGKVIDPSKIQLGYFNYQGSFLIEASPEVNCQRGYHYDPLTQVITLCPKTCEEIIATPGGNVIAVAGCY